MDLQKYTLESFNEVEPYKELELIEDSFEKAREEKRLADYAASLGFDRRQFQRMLRAYRKQLKDSSIVVLENGGLTDFDGQRDALMLASWNADESGIWRKARDGTREYACSHPIYPSRLLTNVDTGEVKVELSFKRGTEGRWASYVVDYDTAANARNVVSLAKIGVNVDSNTAKNLVAYLSEITNKNYDKIPKVKTVSHLGWNREGFAPYTGGVEYDGNPNFDSIYKAVKPKGSTESLAAWIDEVEKCRKYSKTVKILTAASFASALIEPLNVLPFFVHLWGMDSGTGKTVAQMVAASVWGNPTVGEGLFTTFKGTQVGFELTASFLHSIPMFIDELQLAKDKNGKVNFNVYELAAGVGKIRGTKTLGIAAVPKWNICFITSGETPIVSEHDGAGALNRVIEVECTAAKKCVEDGHRTATILKSNYGFGGRAFILHLMKDGEIGRAKELYEKFYAECIKDQASEKQAMAAATILTADALACEWIFADEPLTVDEIKEFLKSSQAVSLAERGYSYLCDWVNMNINNFITDSREVVTGQCFGKVQYVPEKGKDVAFIYPAAFDKACEDAQISPKALLSHLNTKGLLYVDAAKGQRTLKKATKINGATVRMCAIVLQNDEEKEAPEEYPF